ncbi:hypothetical protein BCR35DRAFT_309660 [Leucosporidium creatinivorum]|uniref:Uncharacterized protein n=1 Tax=Leucosporidium creatinivorum TaxID=106004 RepID=A0A1Y2DDP3_9BASI|nr:hypothetical protein BCR35DRAFT_309660 [Leucosporidium creatinivorum]
MNVAHPLSFTKLTSAFLPFQLASPSSASKSKTATSTKPTPSNKIAQWSKASEQELESEIVSFFLSLSRSLGARSRLADFVRFAQLHAWDYQYW